MYKKGSTFYEKSGFEFSAYKNHLGSRNARIMTSLDNNVSNLCTHTIGLLLNFRGLSVISQLKEFRSPSRSRPFCGFNAPDTGISIFQSHRHGGGILLGTGVCSIGKQSFARKWRILSGPLATTPHRSPSFGRPNQGRRF